MKTVDLLTHRHGKNVYRRLSMMAVTLVLSFVIGLHAFLPVTKTCPRFLPSLCATKATITQEDVIHYSINFHHYICCRKMGNETNIVKSFPFLDQAMAAFPRAQYLPSNVSLSFSHAGAGVSTNNTILTTGYPLTNPFLKSLWPVSASVEEKYETFLTAFEDFEGCSYFETHPTDLHPWLKERLLFCLSPLPSDLSAVKDWPVAFSTKGYGVGFTSSQLLSMVVCLPHFMCFDNDEAAERKPPPAYMVARLGVPVELFFQTRDAMMEYLMGASMCDSAAFSFLRHIGLSLDQCRVMAAAFSTSIISVDLDPSWEVRQGGKLRDHLDGPTTSYLRQRLQISTADLFTMMKKHNRLSSYSKPLLVRKLDVLQTQLQASSADIQKIVVRYPSILGVAEAKLVQRIDFLPQSIGLSIEDTSRVITKAPSLLTYSIENNLQPKLDFLKNNLGLSDGNLTKVIVSCPSILGRSFERALKPLMEGIESSYDLKPREFGLAVVKLPSLLTLNFRTNVAPKLQFLQSRLKMSKADLKQIILSNPSILLYNVNRSIEPKIRLVERATKGDVDGSLLVRANPSLLACSLSVLQQRVASAQTTNTTVEEVLRKRADRAPGTRARRKKTVNRILDGRVVETLASVAIAAEAANTSQTNMYSIIRQGRPYRGFTYALGELPKQETLPTQTESQQDLRADSPETSTTSRRNISLSEVLRNKKWSKFSTSEEHDRPYLAVFVSGRCYPPETETNQQGDSRSGGHVIYFPQFDDCSPSSNLMQKAAADIFGERYEWLASEKPSGGGVINLGFNGIFASRNRCSLDACDDALRIIDRMIAARKPWQNLAGEVLEVDVFTDSNYAIALLENSTDLIRWGASGPFSNFSYDGVMPRWEANVNSLYCITKRFNQIATGYSLPKEENDPPSHLKQVRIQFRHKSAVSALIEDRIIKNIDVLATEVAQEMRDKNFDELL